MSLCKYDINFKCHTISFKHPPIDILLMFWLCFGCVLLRKAPPATSVTESVTNDDRNPCITHIYAYLSYMCHNKTSKIF